MSVPVLFYTVDVNVNLQSSFAEEANFSDIMFIAYHELSGPRVQEFASLQGAVDAGFTNVATPSIYRGLVTFFSQEKRPPTIKIGKRLLAPTEIIRLIPEAPAEDKVYSYEYDGIPVSYTALITDTLAALCTALAAAHNGSDAGLTSTADGSSGTHVDITANTAGELHQYSNFTKTLGLQNVTVDPGLATDLAEINEANSSWYFPILDSRSEAEITALDTWANTVQKESPKLARVEHYDTSAGDSAVIDDLASDLIAANTNRTVLHFKRTTQANWDMALAAQIAASPIGRAKDAHQEVQGVPADTFDNLPLPGSTFIANALAKNVTVHVTAKGLSYSKNGITADGELGETIRGSDWFADRLKTRILTLFVNSTEKIPYTQGGIELILAEANGAVQEAIDQGVIDGRDSEFPPFIEPINLADITPAQRQSRILPNVKVWARVTGAIHQTLFDINLVP